jgi:L-ascorbate metabolism protein UlaG (beta-lactamase superfamily)
MNRKRAVVICIAVGLISFIGYKCNSMAQEKIEYIFNPELEMIKNGYEGNITIDGIFCNGLTKDKAPTGKVIKWKLSSNPQQKEKKEDNFSLDIVIDTSFQNNNDDLIVWLGHSSFFMRIKGVTYITDPIMSNLPTSKRKVPNPYEISTLGKIDYILISHAHFDHFDITTLKEIVKKNPKTEILGPMGINKLLDDKVFESIKTQEAGWFQKFDTGSLNEIVFLPAKHWHRRNLFDFNKVLWGGFGVRAGDLKIYFAGDTAKEDDFFNQINEIYNGFDICMIPIGAYSPQFLMKDEHVNPEEAIGIFQQVKGGYFIPMHYGTYDLSDEPLGEPIKRLNNHASEKGLKDKMLNLAVGESLYLNSRFSSK